MKLTNETIVFEFTLHSVISDARLVQGECNVKLAFIAEPKPKLAVVTCLQRQRYDDFRIYEALIMKR